jgi:hypothetical protein
LNFSTFYFSENICQVIFGNDLYNIYANKGKYMKIFPPKIN